MQRLSEQKDVISFSNCSDTTLKDLLSELKIDIDVIDNYCPDLTQTFIPFQWKNNEDKDTNRAMKHIETELGKFGVSFGVNSYKMYDVHTAKNVLNINDPKMTKILKGGTDLVSVTFRSIKQNSFFHFLIPDNSSIWKTSDQCNESGLRCC